MSLGALAWWLPLNVTWGFFVLGPLLLWWWQRLGLKRPPVLGRPKEGGAR